MTISVIEPHGFCGGVARAIKMAHEALAHEATGRIYCLHEIVHNEEVVQSLSAKGLRLVKRVEDVPPGAAVLISAHGTSPDVRAALAARGVRIIDATCPFVAAVHAKIQENFRQGIRTVVVGKADHAEVRGYLGEPGACLPKDVRPGEVTARVVQTTLDAGAHEGVCAAARERQRAVTAFVDAHREDKASVGLLVVGSMKSSNTNRLAEIAARAGMPVWRMASADEVAMADFSGIEILGATSGASTPESQFNEVLNAIARRSVGESDCGA